MGTGTNNPDRGRILLLRQEQPKPAQTTILISVYAFLSQVGCAITPDAGEKSAGSRITCQDELGRLFRVEALLTEPECVESGPAVLLP
jgi:hypothetical protein